MQNIDFQHKKALVRVDYNVPFNDHNEITDSTRILATIPTIQAIIQQNGKVILLSHLGRPKGKIDIRYSLLPVAHKLEEILQLPVLFLSNCKGQGVKLAIDNAPWGTIILLENVRFYAEEEKGDTEFAKELAELADIYVNDAFGTAHRAHASTSVIVPYFGSNAYFGMVMQKEIKAIDTMLYNSKPPVLAIIGGAKVSSKIAILKNLIPRINTLLIGGGMAFTFIKAMGGNIGKSLVEDQYLTTALEIIELCKTQDVTLLLPIDVVAGDAFDNETTIKHVDAAAIPAEYMGMDIGEKSIQLFVDAIQQSSTILWNGPMGVFEFSNFKNGTQKIAEAVAQVTEDNNAYSIIGGGDSVAAIQQFQLQDKVSYVSTGGGAMLEYLEGIELPGIKAIKDIERTKQL